MADKDSGYLKGLHGLSGSGTFYSMGRADRFSNAARQNTPVSPGPTGPSALSGVGTIAILLLFAAAALIVWPWCMQNGVNVRMARAVTGPSLDFGSALILSDVALFFILLFSCCFLALRLPTMSLLAAAAMLYFRFKS